MEKVKFAIPAGSLAEATFEILQRSGYKVSGQERTYRPTINDPKIELKILRPQEIPVFVSEGLQDVGITGQDWIRETCADVEVLQNLEYGKIRLVVAMPKSFGEADSASSFMEELWSKGKNVRVSTEYLNIAAEYVKNNPSYQKLFGNAEPLLVTPWWRKGENARAKIFLSFGATEAKPPENADLIIDVTDTGSTMEQNNLKITKTIMESSAVLIAIKKVGKNGDGALIEFAEKFDKATLEAENLRVTAKKIEEAYKATSKEQISALKLMKSKVGSLETRVLERIKIE